MKSSKKIAFWNRTNATQYYEENGRYPIPGSNETGPSAPGLSPFPGFIWDASYLGPNYHYEWYSYYGDGGTGEGKDDGTLGCYYLILGTDNLGSYIYKMIVCSGCPNDGYDYCDDGYNYLDPVNPMPL